MTVVLWPSEKQERDGARVQLSGQIETGATPEIDVHDRTMRRPGVDHSEAGFGLIARANCRCASVFEATLSVCGEIIVVLRHKHAAALKDRKACRVGRHQARLPG